MKDLKQLLERIGCGKVKTYNQSGNVVFKSSSNSTQPSQNIADEIEVNRGYKPRVMVLKESEFKQAVACNPFPEGEANPKALHLGFLDSVPSSPELWKLETEKYRARSLNWLAVYFICWLLTA